VQPSPTPNTTPDEFDCNAGLAKWKTGWSAYKTSWCCENKPKGCDEAARIEAARIESDRVELDQKAKEEEAEAARDEAPTSCQGLKMEDFEGKAVTVTQTSTLHGSVTYTYIISIGGEIRQQTSDGGNYLIGNHASYGDMTETFTNGDRCGSVARSATITYTFGPELKLLKANEPSMCIYEYEVQLPESDCAQA